MRDNLVPTVIVDKNNKTTTVYKKDDKSIGSTSSIPAPRGTTQSVISNTTSLPFLHALFPALRRRFERKQQEAESIGDRESHAALVSALQAKELHHLTGHFEKMPAATLQKMIEILDAVNHDDGRNGNYASVLHAATRPVYGEQDESFEIAHSNCDALRAGVQFDFLLMMAGNLQPGEYRIKNIEAHVEMDRVLVEAGGQRVYWKLRSLQSAIDTSPEQGGSLARLGMVIMSKRTTTLAIDESDVPQRFLSFIDEWPDREDSILEHYERFGESQFTREVLSQALSTHTAVDEGWL